jgi:hypothetical protein
VVKGNLSNIRFMGAGMERKERADWRAEPEACETFICSLFGCMVESLPSRSLGDISAGRFSTRLYSSTFL